MKQYKIEAICRYGFAAAAVVVIVFIRQITDRLFIAGPPLLLFLAAVIVTARYAGLRAGLLATALCGLVSTYYYLEPIGSLRIRTVSDEFRMAVFLLEGIAISSLMGSLRSARKRAEVGTLEATRQKEALRVANDEMEARVETRTAELARVNETLRLEISGRERAQAVLRQRTGDLEAAHVRLASTARFVSTLNQSGMLDAYSGALGCIVQATGIPVAVIYDCGHGHPPVAHCAIGADHQILDSAPFTGAGLPATVVHTAAVQTLTGPFDSAQLRLHFGLGEVGLHSVIGWPVVFQGRCLGALVTGHTAPLSEDRRSFITESILQFAIRMDGFQVEQQRLRLMSDLQAQSLALEAAKQEAERASRVKSEFLANMSQELRTPMNSLMGFTQRLIRKLANTLPERELDALRTVDRNAKHLLALMNSILDLSKIDAEQMELNWSHLDLAPVVREAAELAMPLVGGKPLTVHLELPDVPLMLDGDLRMLKQVVLNLLANGINHTNAGSVTISAYAAADALLGPVARLSVRDTGIGIRPEDLGQLFQQFTPANGGSSRKGHESRLELVISERFVGLHGGRLDVTSELGRGTEFTALLPLSRVAGPRQDGVNVLRTDPPHESFPRRRSAPHSGFEGLRILCVDDDPDSLNLLRLTFEDAGYVVLLAADHDAAIAGAKTGHPDLICLDLKMPGKDGYEILKSLRADPDLAEAPVIVVSVNSEEARRLGCGVRRYLAKPFDADRLIEAVGDVLACKVGSALVIEDNPDNLRLLVETLTEHGMSVRTASNGREGLDYLAKSTPSVIVLDLMMPVMDGFAFLEHVQSDPAWSRIPVVILSAKILNPEEIDRLGRSSAAVLIKGRDDTEHVIDAILRAAKSGHRSPEGVEP